MDEARRVTRDQLERFAAEIGDPSDLCLDEIVGGFYAALDPVDVERFSVDFAVPSLPEHLAEFMRRHMPEPAAVSTTHDDQAVDDREAWPRSMCPVFRTYPELGFGETGYCFRPCHDDGDHRFVVDDQHRPRPVEADEIVTVGEGESWVGAVVSE